ncbi:uncharacterized protein PAC_02808 [Phialocephala subalpina]|uniref:C6 zinc finger domain protein n=1 Tax=Phialocephala subalpina TaxID=576137 RepID=A0A1L7WJJ9_9HELO|nr:uncharacterized protein PAC_02808 [Phialocephala subalpina]
MKQGWQYDLPLAAQSHEFLMHAILGLSALHKAHFFPATHLNYYSLALKHQTKASEKFRSAVDEISTSNSTAVFGVTFVFAIFQFKHCTSIDPFSPKEGIDTICDAISTLRCAFVLARQHRNLFKDTCFGSLPKRAKSIKLNPLDENVIQALDALDATNICSDTLLEEKVVCTRAVQHLRDWYHMVRPYPRSWDMVLRWPGTISPEFDALLRQGHLMAWIIFAHWCVPVHRLSKRWFIDGWAEATRTPIYNASEHSYARGKIGSFASKDGKVIFVHKDASLEMSHGTEGIMYWGRKAVLCYQQEEVQEAEAPGDDDCCYGCDSGVVVA